MGLRPEVLAFAWAMESKLKAHDAAKGKQGWKRIKVLDLLDMLKLEIEELEAISRPDKVLNECADIANFAMMIADVAGNLMGEGKKAKVALDALDGGF